MACTQIIDQVAWAHTPKAPRSVCTLISGLGSHRWVHTSTNGLDAHRRPHLKHLGLNTSHLASVHRALQGLLAL